MYLFAQFLGVGMDASAAGRQTGSCGVFADGLHEWSIKLNLSPTWLYAGWLPPVCLYVCCMQGRRKRESVCVCDVMAAVLFLEEELISSV